MWFQSIIESSLFGIPHLERNAHTMECFLIIKMGINHSELVYLKPVIAGTIPGLGGIINLKLQ